MNRYINIFAALIVALIFSACSKEDPFFGGDENKDMGQVRKSALAPGMANEEGLAIFSRPGTRAEAPSADSFTIDFIKDGEETPYVSYAYAQMPEVVSLPVGAYTAVAYYGDNAAADWEAPYFRGETKFIVVKDKITEDVEPIVATLSNVRVSIHFAPALKAAMSPDAKVTVKVGDAGSLDFTASDEGRSAYFAYVENSCSLTATFQGDVDGFPVTESKVYDTVAPGSHYSVTFRLNNVDDDETGTLEGTFVVDATVEVVDMNVTIDGEDDDVLTDDLRPVEGEPENPNPGTDPGDAGDEPDPATPGITPMAAPAGKTPIIFDDWNIVDVDNTYAAFKISSSAPTGFDSVSIQIVSEKLNPSELGTIGLTDKFDLADSKDSDYWGPLEGLGFPTNIKGRKEAEFDISTFLGLMVVLGTPADHKFVITVTDANGTMTKTLMLRFN